MHVNDYLKVKMHLLKTIQMVQQRSFIGNFNAANTTSIDAKLKRNTLILQMMPKNTLNILLITLEKIAHQREHFALLSRDMNDMINFWNQ
jgi:hypothetical protein